MKLNIHTIATSNPSSVGYHFDTIKTGSYDYAPSFGFELFDNKKNFQHKPEYIYLTSDEVIKEGDIHLNSKYGKGNLIGVSSTGEYMTYKVLIDQEELGNGPLESSIYNYLSVKVISEEGYDVTTNSSTFTINK
jgi:hypothetical protein